MSSIEKRFEPKFKVKRKEVKTPDIRKEGTEKEEKFSEEEVFELLDELKNPELIEENLNKFTEDIKKSPEIKEILEKPIFEVKKGDLLYSFGNGDRVLFRRNAQKEIEKIKESSFTEKEGWKRESNAFGIGRERGDNFLIEKVILPKDEEIETDYTGSWETSKKYEKRVKEEAEEKNLKPVCHFHTHLQGDLTRSGGDLKQWERMGYKFNMRLASIFVPEDKKELFFFGERNKEIKEKEGEVGEGEREKFKNIFEFPREPREDIKEKLFQKKEIEKELKPKEMIKDRVDFFLKEKREEIRNIENKISKFKKIIPLQKEFITTKQKVKEEKRKPTVKEAEKFLVLKHLMQKEKFKDIFTPLDEEIQNLEIKKTLKENEMKRIENSQKEFKKVFKNF